MGRDLTKMLSTLPLLYLILFPAPSATQILNMKLYKSCLMECFNCVKTYGKDFYNGKLCAENCAHSSGKSIDGNCAPPDKRAGRVPNLTSSCKSICENDCRYNSYRDTSFCVLSCILSSQKYTKC